MMMTYKEIRDALDMIREAHEAEPMITTEGKKLYATGDGNWDLYQDDRGYLYSIAKPGTGCQNTCFGWPEHLRRLERAGIRHGYTLI